MKDDVLSLVSKLNRLINAVYSRVGLSDETAFVVDSEELAGQYKPKIRKITSHSMLLQIIFNIKGVKVSHELVNGKPSIVLTETEVGAFAQFNRDFERLSPAIEQKMLAEAKVFKSRQNPYLKSVFVVPVAPKNTLLDRLAHQTDEIVLDLINLAQLMSSDVLRELQDKKIKFLSLRSCNLVDLSLDIFSQLCALISKDSIREIHLENNDLGKLTQEKLKLLLNALKNKQKIFLDNNNLNEVLNDNATLLVDFLQNSSPSLMSLRKNQLNDTVAEALGTQGRMEILDLGYNSLSDAGVLSFSNNKFVTQINLFGNDFTSDALERLDAVTFQNKKAAFVEKIKMFAQGTKDLNNIISTLPNETILNIMTSSGSDFKHPENVENLCRLIMDNVAKSKPGNLFWKKNLMLEKATFPIFRSPGQHNESHPEVKSSYPGRY